MNHGLSTKLNDCLRLTNRLGEQLQEAEDSISFCVGGEIRRSYLENCTLAESRIDELKRGLQSLYVEIELFEQQQQMEAL